MSILFEPMKIMHMDLRNRFVRSATYDGCANKSGYVTENQMDLYSALAEGGVGLIITGITYVHPTGQISSFQNSIVGDEFIHGFKRLTAAVHSRGGKNCCSVVSCRKGGEVSGLESIGEIQTEFKANRTMSAKSRSDFYT